ncbi:hypothetical protein MBRA_39410 [Mycobacterium branderi]|uniref:Uncharacterized protein n=1 Tax=Mycobacterium branderi TaxID=43348 RepID=A0ABN6BBV9_9MYCO|nr:hypothetical protein MBRA_39410 [Mycobacterium branderi]
MFEPITASPVTPICALPFDCDELMYPPLSFGARVKALHRTLWHRAHSRRPAAPGFAALAIAARPVAASR